MLPNVSAIDHVWRRQSFIGVKHTFNILETYSVNDAQGWSGNRIDFGADSVALCNGNPISYTVIVPLSQNATGMGSQAGYTNVPMKPEVWTYDPYFWSGHVNLTGTQLPADLNLTGAWSMSFQDGNLQTTRPVTGTLQNAALVPFVQNVTITGTNNNPTFSWTVPQTFTPDGVRVLVWDLQNRMPTGVADLINKVELQYSNGAFPTSYTVSTPTLASGHEYSIEVQLLQSRDGQNLTNTYDDNVLSRSGAFFDFTPLNASAPANVYLPMVTPAPNSPPGTVQAYSFTATVSNASGQPQQIFIDPRWALGYIYATGQGNPNFASVEAPSGIQVGSFQLSVPDGKGGWITLGNIDGGTWYPFRGLFNRSEPVSYSWH